MAIPTSYTEATLKAFLHSEAGNVADVLSWSVAGEDYDEPVYDAIFAMGVDAITSITTRADISKLRCFARLAMWKKALGHLADKYDENADGSDNARSQMYKMVKGNIDVLQAQANQYAPFTDIEPGEIEVDALDHSAEDPYDRDFEEED